jgi:hypothetical protein
MANVSERLGQKTPTAGVSVATLLVVILAISRCSGASPSPLPTPAPTPPAPSPPTGAANRMSVAILVDSRAPQTPRGDVERVFARAVQTLLEKTGESMAAAELTYGPAGATTSDIVARYLATKVAATAPDGILIFTNDASAHTYGGYSFVVPGPTGFQSRYPSPRPEVGAGKVYIAVVEFDHLYAKCGYGDSDTHTSSVSVGGECFNRPGTPCVAQGSAWVCSTALADLYIDHDYFTAASIVHEFLHPFGIDANESFDHYGTPACIARTGMTSAQAADRNQAELNCGLCPDVFPRFRHR